MRLKELTYIEPGFSIEGLYFNYVNLVVGKNTAGKSRAVAVIKKFYQLILQKYTIKENDFFEYKVTFSDGDVDISYRLVCQAGEVFIESLDDSYSHYLDRQCGITCLHGQNICPPKNKLCFNVRRDAEDYPIMEKIVRWAAQSCTFSFGSYDLFCGNNEYGIVSMYDSMSEDGRRGVLNMMNNVGYNIEEIKVVRIGCSLKFMMVSEKDVLEVIDMESLSRSMKQSLYVAILINYLAGVSGDSRTLIVDGLCDGMDFERSVSLGKYVYEYCVKHGIQLIATTNDTFLMDTVNINYWNILRREGGRVVALNIHNASDTFSSFKSKNLSNYHLLTFV